MADMLKGLSLMTDRRELIEAMRKISDQCERFCAGCVIEKECLECFDGFPCEWDLEDGEQSE